MLFRSMKLAVLMQKANRLDPESLTAEKALEMATIDGAKALNMEKEIGSLEVGKVADFVAWQIDRPADLAYWLGGELDKRVVRHGVDVTV